MSTPAAGDWGKINGKQRYTLLAIDVDRALSRAGLGDYEQPIMQFLREYSWGTATRSKPSGRSTPWPDARAVEWKPGEVARRMGLPRNRVSEAKAALVKSRMIVETRDGLMINKCADQWVYPEGHRRAGQARLDDAAMTYALAARPDPETTEVSGIPDESVRPSGHPSTNPCPEFRTDLSAPADNLVRSGGQPCPEFRTTPIEERARQKTPEDSEIKTSSPTTGADGDEFAPLARWADSLKGRETERLGYWVESLRGQYPAAWVREAIEQALASAKGNARSYALRVLRGWHVSGKPDLKAEEEARRAGREPRAAVVLPYIEPPADPRYRRLPLRDGGGA